MEIRLWTKTSTDILFAMVNLRSANIWLSHFRGWNIIRAQCYKLSSKNVQNTQSIIFRVRFEVKFWPDQQWNTWICSLHCPIRFINVNKQKCLICLLALRITNLLFAIDVLKNTLMILLNFDCTILFYDQYRIEFSRTVSQY